MCRPLRPLLLMLSDVECQGSHASSAPSCVTLARPLGLLNPRVFLAKWLVQSLPASRGCCDTQVRQKVFFRNSKVSSL